MRFQLSQLQIERTCLSYLLWIDGGSLSIDTRENFLVQEGRYPIGGVVHKPILDSNGPIAKFIWIAWLLHTELREMANTKRYQLTALSGIQLPLLIEEFVHIHTPQLCDPLFLRHFLVELIYLLFHIYSCVTTCH